MEPPILFTGRMTFVRSPYCAVSIALYEKKQALVGVVYNPIRDEIFSAVAGKGAFLNNKPIHVSDCANLKESLVICQAGL